MFLEGFYVENNAIWDTLKVYVSGNYMIYSILRVYNTTDMQVLS